MSERGGRRGRKRTYDADKTKAAIVCAAESSFAEHGYSGVSVNKIASMAGCNKSLIFQCFGNKKGLYLAVLTGADDALADLLERALAPLLQTGLQGLDGRRFMPFLKKLFGAFFDYMIGNPKFARIMAWEQAAEWKVFGEIASRLEPRDMPKLEAVFARARRTGLLRPDVDTAVLITLALQACWATAVSLPLYRKPLLGKGNAPSLAYLRGQVVELLASGAAVRGSSASGR